MQLPPELAVDVPLIMAPDRILNHKIVEINVQPTPQSLVKWQGQPTEDATWLDDADIQGQFLDFSLEDKAVLPEGGNVTKEQSKGRAKNTWIVYSRKSRRQQLQRQQLWVCEWNDLK